MKELRVGQRVIVDGKERGRIHRLPVEGTDLVTVDFDDLLGTMARVSVHTDHVRPETLWEFKTRRTGYGLTSWPQFALIVGLALLFIVAGVFSYTWFACAMGVLILVGLEIGTYQNWRGKQS